MAGIRIERGVINRAQTRMAAYTLSPPPAAPQPKRWRPWMTVACIAGGVLLVLIIVVVSCTASGPSQPPAPPTNLPAWAASNNAASGGQLAPAPVTPPAPVAAPVEAVAGGTQVVAREPNKWQSKTCSFGPNFVVNADFGLPLGALPKGWEVVGAASPAMTVQAPNSPFTAFFADNGKAARLQVAKDSANQTPAFRLPLGGLVKNDASMGQRVLFAWDTRVAPGTDTWTIEDRAGGKAMAFSLQVGRDAVMLDNSEYAMAKLDSNAWHHVELYVNYEDANVCVEGLLYNSAGKVLRTWRKQEAMSMIDRKQPPTGCEELFIQGKAVDGNRAVLIDNLYIGIVSQRR